MELKEGMYARVNNDFRIIYTGIGKITKIVDDTVYVQMREDMSVSFPKKQIEKASFNLIDLIGAGDIIETPKGVFQVDYIANDVVYTDTSKVIVCLRQDEHLCFENDIIESIVTKEQFNLMKYVVEDEEK